MGPLSEKQARAKLQKILDWKYANLHNYSESNLYGDKGKGYVEHFITRMYNEFGGKWDEHKAREFLNALAAEDGIRNI